MLALPHLCMSYFATRQSTLILVAVQRNLILFTDTLVSGSVVVAYSCICPNLQTSGPHPILLSARHMKILGYQQMAEMRNAFLSSHFGFCATCEGLMN